ncbi:Uncharacterised protein [Flavonifractor plautii]|uniref:Uncharacterized protein n=1 Tax=Flavonifractor plautii TaxID=292800 RepID=A0A174WER4_FLAPL|nr:Uncharacterised protein [Flavonifractor plautii]
MVSASARVAAAAKTSSVSMPSSSRSSRNSPRMSTSSPSSMAAPWIPARASTRSSGVSTAG